MTATAKAKTAPAHDTPSFMPDQRQRTENDLTKEERDALVLGCVNLCRKLAGNAAATVPGADFENLEGDAILACVEAARVFTLEGDAKFSTFATTFIKKRLLGHAADEREHAGPTRLESWGEVADPDALEPGYSFSFGQKEDDADLLAKLDEPARTAVWLVVFERTTPEQAAGQLGLPVKDLKLILRNSAKELIRQKARAAAPGLFVPDAVCEFCNGRTVICEECFETATECLCPTTSTAGLIPCPDCGEA